MTIYIYISEVSAGVVCTRKEGVEEAGTPRYLPLFFSPFWCPRAKGAKLPPISFLLLSVFSEEKKVINFVLRSPLLLCSD